jgi:hypothetical protein
MRKILLAFLAMLTLASVLSGCFYYPYPYHYRYDRYDRYDRDYRYDRGYHGEGGYDDRRDGHRDSR